MGTDSHPKPSEGLGAAVGPSAATVVIGATGILRSAAVELAESGATVVAVARDGKRLDQLTADLAYAAGGVVGLAADATRPDFVAELRGLLDRRRLRMQTVLVYGPTTSSDVLADLLRMVEAGMLVEILVSQSARPRRRRPWRLSDLPTSRDGHRRLVLGWRREGDTSRWHTADEISSAALAVLAEPGDHVLGSVSPWADRPT